MPDVPRPIDFLESSFRQSDVFDSSQDVQTANLNNLLKKLNNASLTPDLVKGIRFFKGLILSVEQKEPELLQKWFGKAYNLFMSATDPVRFFRVRIPELDAGVIPLPPLYADTKIDFNNTQELDEYTLSIQLINRHRRMKIFDESNISTKNLKAGDIVWIFFNNSNTLLEPYIFSSMRRSEVPQPISNANERPATPNPNNPSAPNPNAPVIPTQADGQNNFESPSDDVSEEKCRDIDSKLATPKGCGRIRATGYKQGIGTPIVLAELIDYPGFYLQQQPVNVWNSFHRMVAEAKGSGIKVEVNSAFRTMAKQRELFAKYQSRTGNLAAKPGFSTHQMGLTVDFNVKPNPALLQWLETNASKYGFFRTVPSENWHWEYTGK